METDAQALREALALATGTHAPDWHLVLKARYGMAAAFRAAREVQGPGSVLTQLFTCLTAVVPVLQAGLAPVYGDLSLRTLALDPSELALPGDLRCLVAQHTFGIIDDRDTRALADAAHAAGALVLEDCAHCVGRMALGPDALPIADVSVHSFGVEKLLPTHFGGAVWLNPESPLKDVIAETARLIDALPVVSGRRARALRLYQNEMRIANHVPGALSRSILDMAGSMGLMEHAISPAEQAGEDPHDEAAPDAWVIAQDLAAMRGLPEIKELRTRATAALRELLAPAAEQGLLKVPAVQCEGEAQPLLRFGVLARDTEAADRAIAAARAQGFYAQAWYRPWLFPGVTNPAAFCVPTDPSALPRTREAVDTIVVLPADLSEDACARLADTLLSA